MILSILTFIAVLSILVLVHEFGHYIMARRNGVWVEEFGFGIPPRVFGKKIGETLYSINLLPFGGFVRLHGEESDKNLSDPKRAFLNKSKKARISIVVAGVVMNFLLAVVAFAIVYSFSGVPRETHRVKIVEVRSGSPAEEAGFKIDDIVKTIGGQNVVSNNGFISSLNSYKGTEVDIEIDRAGSIIDLKATPRVNPPEGEGSLGVVISTSEIYFPPLWQRPFYGVYYGFKDAYYWTKLILGGMASIFTKLASGHVPKDVAGPVGIYALTTEAVKFGILPLINFIGVLSVNLGTLNVLPFPALDGGRLLFVLIEAVLGKKVVPKVEAAIHTVGMIILLALILLITISDVYRLVTSGGVAGYLKSIVK